MDNEVKTNPGQEEIPAVTPEDGGTAAQTAAAGEIPPAGDGTEMPAAKRRRFKLTKKTAIILGAVAVVVIAAAFVLLHKSKFEKVREECVHIAGMVSRSGDYFTIDTYPDAYENMDEALVAMLLPNAQKNALEAIKYANEELGFNGSVYSQMMKTSALMGRQSEENDKYKVSWTYHPDDGLEVTYEKK